MDYFKKKNILLIINVFLKIQGKKLLTAISPSICQEVTHSKKRVYEAEMFSEGA